MSNLFKKVILSIVFIALIMPKAKAETNDQHTKVVMRTIGHEFLLQMNDSTTRILAIEKTDGRYRMKFEKNISFDPGSLSFATIKILEEKKITESYIVEVQNCSGNEVIYSFKASLNELGDLLPCVGRILPMECYSIYFTEIGNTEATSSEKHTKSSLFNYLLGILLIIGISLLVYLRKKRDSRQSSNLIQLGQYEFNQKKMLLTLKEQSTELSSKEADLLFLLCSNENKTLERKYILNVVWGDEGDYIGRTLDVFISKLRKKLEGDLSLKIINVRGVGYKFVIY